MLEPLLFSDATSQNETWQFCVDCRELNAHTIKNKYPIPIIDDLLDELNEVAVFSKIDLRIGYHQIIVKEEDVTKTGCFDTL